ncbi:Ferredoxin [Pelotomaculum schinkii]|uniref:Ferredoxin n=1 Tax=Pelotomaculum schinkii TaxID=78350 RepID=A0A4Y7RE79_9FIRM|nr:MULTISPECIES: ferredoxin [Pelotomaculum]TEB07083.1 Ferredoxin [Pelotomaculum schinkii]TEB17002.1 Ferredoxin [Pelotomaculum sp. FP]
MQVEVDQELCISCGVCVDLCPDVFGWNENEKAHSTVDEVPAEFEEVAQEAIDSCPTSAISGD